MVNRLTTQYQSAESRVETNIKHGINRKSAHLSAYQEHIRVYIKEKNSSLACSMLNGEPIKVLLVASEGG